MLRSVKAFEPSSINLNLSRWTAFVPFLPKKERNDPIGRISPYTNKIYLKLKFFVEFELHCC